jgi:hydrophobic/amphiphilic exporter-1 (mainly G- bacteria), HAE1 family
VNGLIKFSLKNASVLVLGVILLTIAGLVATSNLKQELLPDIKFPVITVITPYPLAGPEIVESQVTKPLETAIQGLADLEEYSSTSSANVSVVVLGFNFGVNLREAEGAVQQAVNRVRTQFPDGVQEPTVSAIRFGDSPVLRLGVSSKLPATELKSKVDALVLPKLEGIGGVSRVDVTGAPKAQVRVTLDQAKLNKYRLDPNTIQQALRAAGLSFPVGSVQDGGLNVPVKLQSVSRAVADLAGVVVTAQPDQAALDKLSKQARDAQIAAARAQGEALGQVANLAGTALRTAGQAAGTAGQAAALAGQAIGQAQAARGIATGAAQAAGQAAQLAGQALGKATAADAKADAALKAAQGAARGDAPVGQAPGQPPVGAPTPDAPTGQAPSSQPGSAPAFPQGAMQPGQAPTGAILGAGQRPPTLPSSGAIPLPSSGAPNFAPTGTASSAPAIPSSGAGLSAPSFGGAAGGAPSGAPSGASFGGASFGGASFGGTSSSVPLVPVTLSEIAKIELTTADPTSYTRLNGDTAVGLNVFKTQQANTLTVANDVKALIPDLETALGGKVTVLSDQGAPIAKGVESLLKEGALGGLFAVLVVLVFLRNWRSTLITAISIPLSLLVGLLLLSVLGFTLNSLTLGGLTIAIGRVIDDAIVVIENIYHRLSLGEPPLKAAYEGAREVGTPVTASTITTVAVFLPLAFVSGIAGEFFRPLALAVTFAILASLLVAFTVIPMLSSIFLRSANKGEEKPSWIETLYRGAITWATGHKGIVLVGAVVALILASLPFPLGLIKTNFVGGGEPSSAEVSLKLKEGTRLGRVNESAKLVERKLESLRAEGIVKSYQTVVGGADNNFALAFGGGTGAAASFTVLPGTQDNGRKIEIAKTLVPRLEEALKGVVPNSEISVVAGAGTGGFAQSLEVQIQATDLNTLRKATDQVLAAVKNVPEVSNPKSNLEAVNTEFVVRVNQKKAYEKGIIPVTVGGTVRQALQGTVATTLNVNDRSVDVLLAFPKGSFDTLEQLKNLKLRPAQGGDSVKLSEIATVTREPSPSSIRRIGGERTATVTAEPAGNNVGGSTTALTNAVKALNLPAGATWKIGGVSAQQQESFQALGIAILAAVALVYLIMVATFRSLLTPFLLLVSIPLVVVGVFPLLTITNTPIGLSVFFGFLLLTGIVVTNAIVLIDLVETYQEQGKPIREALIEGGSRRVRPIVMTALTTILALMPSALGLFESSGGIIGQPLALTVIGGLTSSTLLTLFVVPALYLAVYSRRKSKSQAARAAKQQQMLEVFGD